ncbi:MAG: hypothetical protein F6K65_34415 [Moorea sp. SIO3C2]|nr:hypothetical protein [Moorena sp. SIO3C2]
MWGVVLGCGVWGVGCGENRHVHKLARKGFINQHLPDLIVTLADSTIPTNFREARSFFPTPYTLHPA